MKLSAVGITDPNDIYDEEYAAAQGGSATAVAEASGIVHENWDEEDEPQTIPFLTTDASDIGVQSADNVQPTNEAAENVAVDSADQDPSQPAVEPATESAVETSPAPAAANKPSKSVDKNVESFREELAEVTAELAEAALALNRATAVAKAAKSDYADVVKRLSAIASRGPSGMPLFDQLFPDSNDEPATATLSTTSTIVTEVVETTVAEAPKDEPPAAESTPADPEDARTNQIYERKSDVAGEATFRPDNPSQNWSDGYQDYLNGNEAEDCPHGPGAEQDEWLTGFCYGEWLDGHDDDEQAELPGDWRDVTTEQLGIPPGICSILKEASPSITTLSELAAYTESGQPLTNLARIGEAKADKIIACVDAYWKEHPVEAEDANSPAS